MKIVIVIVIVVVTVIVLVIILLLSEIFGFFDRLIFYVFRWSGGWTLAHRPWPNAAAPSKKIKNSPINGEGTPGAIGGRRPTHIFDAFLN